MASPDRPTPERLYATLTGYQTSAALAAAIRLELFTHVAAGADTPAALVPLAGASERGLRALLNHLVAHGFLVKRGERYACAEISALFLDRRSPAYQGSIATFLTDPGLVRCFDDLEGAIRRGGTVERAGGTVAAENPVWVEFARAMAPVARSFAPAFADVVCRAGAPRRVLDVAAGHGLYGIEVARRSDAGQVTFQDWPGVLAVARANVEQAGLAARARYLAGSAFEVELGSGHDAILVTNFLHHFPRESCAAFLARCRAALAPGGRVAVLEFVLEEDRVTPSRSAAFDLVMVATTPGGVAYTVGEYGQIFREAGLAHPERHDLPEGTHTVLVAGPGP
ncbi:MAG TPA: methyltransferase [Planctomycetota bacterium]